MVADCQGNVGFEEEEEEEEEEENVFVTSSLATMSFTGFLLLFL